MGDKECTVRARELGSALRRAVQASGLSNMDLARRLGWSPSKVTYLFQGKRGYIETDVAQVLAVCRVIGPERDRLLRLARDSHEPTWWNEHNNDPGRTVLRSIVNHEERAVSVTNYDNHVIPGLLQTEDYMQALMRTCATTSADEIDELVQTRLHRQNIFNRYPRPATCRFFIEEYVLRRTGPGQEIMSEQLHHLLRVSVRPRATIRVVPDSAGFHLGKSPFHMTTFEDIGPVVYTEGAASSGFFEHPESVAIFQRILSNLSAVALDEERSRRWIAALARERSEVSTDFDKIGIWSGR